MFYKGSKSLNHNLYLFSQLLVKLANSQGISIHLEQLNFMVTWKWKLSF